MLMPLEIRREDSLDPHGDATVLTAGAALGAAKAAMIMIHGRGANAADILSLSDVFGRRDFACFAPEASAHTWYPRPFTAPVDQNEPHLSSALRAIARLLADIARGGILPDKVVLLGFSQGACLALTFAARNPMRFGGVVALSGGSDRRRAEPCRLHRLARRDAGLHRLQRRRSAHPARPRAAFDGDHARPRRRGDGTHLSGLRPCHQRGRGGECARDPRSRDRPVRAV